MQRMDGAPRRVRVDLGSQASRGYDVLVGEGTLAGLPSLLESVCPAHRYVLISDDRVAGLHAAGVEAGLRDAGARVDTLTFPAGEANKSRESWARLSDEMFAADVGRDAAVLALGGGVTGDLAGFVAATYMRGLPLVQLPTSLLAMIDSSVGGKTGVDTPAGKNLIGAFMQPAVVVADIATLSTLPVGELKAGMVEAVKHGAIADAAYFQSIAMDLPSLVALDRARVGDLVLRSVEIKAHVVGLDEREGGQRKTLNFGHTIGHAVEALSGFRLLHGEAIAIGMVVEAGIGESVGVTERGTREAVGDLLRRLGMPVEVPTEMSAEAVLAATRSDKKARKGRVEYSLLERLGSASAAEGRWAHPIEDAVVLAEVRRRAKP
jgi:3-dehydroquinate synthase